MSATALYKALIEAKVSEETAEKAVEDMEFARDVATKADIAQLRAEIAGSEARMAKWNIALHIAFAGLIIAAIKFL